MSELITTEGIVLSKVNFSETSKISLIFTNELGKIPVIIKGGRSASTKIGKVIDPLNHVSLVAYNRQTRDVQTLGNADLLHYYPEIRENFESMKYAYSVLELVDQVILEHEVNHRVFKGVKRILERLDQGTEHPGISFTRFFIFFIEELGFALHHSNCSICSLEINPPEIYLHQEQGFLCQSCSSRFNAGTQLNRELFSYFNCLKLGIEIVIGQSQINYIISFLERYLNYHIPTYKKLVSLNL